MGVKDLWNVISPVGRKTTLFELQGKTVAVDLSGWVCENQVIGEKNPSCQTRMYLRNIFFRTCVLLMYEITPIFVLEGKAPELKVDTIVARNVARGDGETGKTGTRRRLKGMLRHCQELLEAMGVMCVEGEGEAEATCAYLNSIGIADGVITQDSDAFLYGAKTVYRNFSIQGGCGSIDVYKVEDIEENLKLDREKLIALSLLCGCDYNGQGVSGVGKETAYKFLSTLGSNTLEYLRQWKLNKDLRKYEKQRDSCTICSHEGKRQDHKKTGCLACSTSVGCTEDNNPTSFRNLTDDKRKALILELNIRRKCLLETSFPNEDMIKEYLALHSVTLARSPKWKCPKVVKLIKFTERMLNWELDYCWEKIKPIFVRWSLLHINKSLLSPISILKKRILKGVPCFEIEWEIHDENINSLISDCCTKTTIEPQVLIESNFPNLYESFMESKTKKKCRKVKKNVESTDEEMKTKQVRNTKHKKVDDIISSMSRLSLCQTKESSSKEEAQNSISDDNSSSSIHESSKTTGRPYITDLEQLGCDEFTQRILKNIQRNQKTEVPDCGTSGYESHGNSTIIYNYCNRSSILNNEHSINKQKRLESSEFDKESILPGKCSELTDASLNLEEDFSNSEEPLTNCSIEAITREESLKACFDISILYNDTNVTDISINGQVSSNIDSLETSIISENEASQSCSHLDSTEDDFDVSMIVNQIISRKRFY